MLHTPPITKKYSLSIIVPCYNEEKSIAGTIEGLLQSEYSGLKKIIVVDDCSTDNSYKIIKKFSTKYPQKVIACQTPKNTGKAAGAKNYGVKFAKTELIGFSDADSYPNKDAITKMIGFFDNPKVGAVTSKVLVKKKEKFIEKLQSIEYQVIAFTRKLLGFIDAIYVTPGPLAIYRKKVFDEIKGFDEDNLTEDIEITWHFVSKGYKIEMSPQSKVYTIAPDKYKAWFKQRLRWNVGGIQTINKYKKSFMKAGMLGNFILPFFVFSWILGIFGLLVLIHQLISKIVLNYLSTSYSLQTQTAIMTMRELNLNPSVLSFFGITIFLLSLTFTFTALRYSKEEGRHGIISILKYMLFYLPAYPIILITSIYKFFRGKQSW